MFALGAHFGGRADDTRRAHILNTDHMARGDDFERGFEQQFLHERITHLHGGQLIRGSRRNIFRGKGGAVNTVFARSRPDNKHRITHAETGCFGRFPTSTIPAEKALTSGLVL